MRIISIIIIIRIICIFIRIINMIRIISIIRIFSMICMIQLVLVLLMLLGLLVLLGLFVWFVWYNSWWTPEAWITKDQDSGMQVEPTTARKPNIGAIIIRLGFLGRTYYNYNNEEPPKIGTGNNFGPYIHAPPSEEGIGQFWAASWSAPRAAPKVIQSL